MFRIVFVVAVVVMPDLTLDFVILFCSVALVLHILLGVRVIFSLRVI